VDVKHQRRGDVRIRLRHPDGTEAVVNNTGSSTRTDLIAVYPDTRQYADDVIALYGKPVAGTWQVIVSDHTSGNTGSIRYLALEIDSNAGGSGNYPPNADAGIDQTVNEGATVNLNGTGSSDPDGDTLSYAWIELGSSWVTIQSASSAQATFTAPMVNSPLNITFQLTVNDGRGGSDSDTVVVTVLDSAVNNPPNADAGPDAYTAHAAVTQLDGSGSSDPENDTLSFSWAQIGGAGTVTLTGANTATPSFTAPGVDDVLVFQLTVNDGNGNSDNDTVTVVVNATGTAPTGGGSPGSSGGGGGKDGGCSTGGDAGWLLLLLLVLVTGTVVGRGLQRD
jgi:subtilisin-like proprotein convertase family protein